jgi:hypothetical protein
MPLNHRVISMRHAGANTVRDARWSTSHRRTERKVPVCSVARSGRYGAISGVMYVIGAGRYSDVRRVGRSVPAVIDTEATRGVLP